MSNQHVAVNWTDSAKVNIIDFKLTRVNLILCIMK